MPLTAALLARLIAGFATHMRAELWRVDGSSHLPRCRHPMVREHRGPPRTDVIVVFAALRFAMARRLRTLGVVQRMRSSVNVLGHVLPRLLGSASPVARPVHGQDPRSPAQWSDRCALRATGEAA
jgi:hypothetical protein